MVKKYFFFLKFAILLFLISFISAGFFSDFAGKITGQVTTCETPGEYNSTSYCGFGRIVEVKEDDGVSCSNNYECLNNSCVDGVCKSQFQEVPEHTTFLGDLWSDFLGFLGIVEDRECTPNTETRECEGLNVGECSSGIETCNSEGSWSGECVGVIGPETEICTDGLDNDCDSFIDNDDSDCLADTCVETVDIDCAPDDDGFCSPVEVCFWDDSGCLAKACTTWNGNEFECLSVGCGWDGTETIFCGNDGKIDLVINEMCDGSNLNGRDCTDYTIESIFTGGALSCNIDCKNFNVSQCTISYFPSDPAVSEILNRINGLAEGTSVTAELLGSLPPGVVLPDKINLISIINISVDIQPPAPAEILFAVNKTDINISEEGVGMYRVESNNSLANLVRTLLPDEGGSYYNYSAITDHFSVFLIVESLDPVCGDGTVNPGEECDGTNLNGKNCNSIGYDSGTLTCDSSCLFFDLSECRLDSGNGGGVSIDILIFSPRGDITYSRRTIPLEVVDTQGNASFWRYSLNNGPEITFAPNTTIGVQRGMQILKIYAKETPESLYGAVKLVNFLVVDNSDPTCGDNICDLGEDCSSCQADCGSCFLVESYCGDNICDSGEDSLNCPSDCEDEQKSNTGFFVLLILVILAAIALAVFFLFRKVPGRKGPEVQGRPTGPAPPTQSPPPTGPGKIFPIQRRPPPPQRRSLPGPSRRPVPVRRGPPPAQPPPRQSVRRPGPGY